MRKRLKALAGDPLEPRFKMTDDTALRGTPPCRPRNRSADLGWLKQTAREAPSARVHVQAPTASVRYWIAARHW